MLNHIVIGCCQSKWRDLIEDQILPGFIDIYFFTWFFSSSKMRGVCLDLSIGPLRHDSGGNKRCIFLALILLFTVSSIWYPTISFSNILLDYNIRRHQESKVAEFWFMWLSQTCRRWFQWLLCKFEHAFQIHVLKVLFKSKCCRKFPWRRLIVQMT